MQHHPLGWPPLQTGPSGGPLQHVWRVRRRRQHRSNTSKGLRLHRDAQEAGRRQVLDKAEEPRHPRQGDNAGLGPWKGCQGKRFKGLLGGGFGRVLYTLVQAEAGHRSGNVGRWR